MYIIYKDEMYFTRHLVDLKTNLIEKQGEDPKQTRIKYT